MKAATIIGIGLAAGCILMAAMMDGTSPAAFMNPAALLLILGGTLGVTMGSVGMETLKTIPTMYKLVMNAEAPDVKAQAELLVSLAEQARREGLLALDAKVGEIEDEFTKKGLQLVVDGSDPDLVREVLEAEIEGMATRHAKGAGMFEKAGGFAPTIGIIGTVMGLVHVLENLSAPSTLGPSISSAFLATLLGVASANVVFLPVAYRLKAMSAGEVELRMLTIEGILSVQAGDNPRIVSEKLLSYVSPSERPGADGATASVSEIPEKQAA